METHKYLIELLDEAEQTEYRSDEWIKIRTRINQYLNQRMLFNDYTIPNRLLLQFAALGFKKDGFWTSIKGIFIGVRKALKKT